MRSVLSLQRQAMTPNRVPAKYLNSIPITMCNSHDQSGVDIWACREPHADADAGADAHHAP